ncbi:hypothetical protein ACFVXC_35230 [Streptomyces sp. NPDC058257]|uniref:hypothetical protein n=1 Tax=unclassified Streptomyces TaxID=2593676 RepID=UPI00364E9B01
MLRKHQEDLRRFRSGLFSTDPAGSGGLAPVSRFGPLRSVTDRHAVLTIIGDINDQAVLLERPGQAGSVLTLSIAAQHKQLGTRQAVDPAEARAWVEAIVGPDWLPHVYSAGALSGLTKGGSSTSRPFTTRYFYLFLGADGVPHAEPEHQLGVQLSPLVDTP